MRYIGFLLFALALCSRTVAVAQTVLQSSGTAEVQLADTLPLERAKEQARQRARIQAIERAFGTVVVQSNTTSIENVAKGSVARTTTRFNTIADTYVKGHWLKTESEDFQQFTVLVKKQVPGKNKTRTVEEQWLRCTTTGTVQEIEGPSYETQAQTLACPDSKCARTDFTEGERLYLSFRSPVDGYLTVFLDDRTTAWRLLPYTNMPEDQRNGMRIEADRTYVLFSQQEEHNYFPSDPYFQEDELKLMAEEPLTVNRLYIAFSTRPFDKPMLLAEQEIQVSGRGRYTLPPRLDSRSLQEWLTAWKSLDGRNFSLSVLDISIKQRKP